MAIKVIGTGAPRMLTVRFRPCEVDVLLDELHHHRAVVTEGAASAHAKSAAPGAGAGDRAVEDHHDELFLITRLVDDLCAPTRPPEGAWRSGSSTSQKREDAHSSSTSPVRLTSTPTP